MISATGSTARPNRPTSKESNPKEAQRQSHAAGTEVDRFPPVESPAGQLEQALSTLVHWSTRREVQTETMRRARCTLPLASASLLSRIRVCGPVHPSQLATFYAVDNSTITPRLQRLERDALIARHSDPEDGRASLVRITPAGEKLCKGLHAARRAILEQLLADWPAEDQLRVAAAASQLADRLEPSPTQRTPDLP